MKLLLDECVPEDLKDFISGHEVASVAEMGWKGIKNGELMHVAVDAGFEAFLTADKNIRHQQNISKYQISVIVFDVFRNTVEELRKKLRGMYELLPTIEKGKLYMC
jgi:predicted nuclease of predicted toxin-antitoxin system